MTRDPRRATHPIRALAEGLGRASRSIAGQSGTSWSTWTCLKCGLKKSADPVEEPDFNLHADRWPQHCDQSMFFGTGSLTPIE